MPADWHAVLFEDWRDHVLVLPYALPHRSINNACHELFNGAKLWHAGLFSSCFCRSLRTRAGV